LRAVLADRTQSLWTRGRAARGLARIANHHPDLRAEAVDALVAQLDPAETRVPVDEEVNAYVACELGDLGAVEAEATIRQAFREDRVDPRIVDANFILKQLDRPLEPTLQPEHAKGRGLHLWLTCTACRRTRGHHVEQVYCDGTTQERRAKGEETQYSEWIIPEPITCPKCGAVNQYELAPETRLALTVELLRQMQEGRSPPGLHDPSSSIAFRRFSADGREMHPLEARDMYRERVAAAPEDVDLRLRYGKVLSMVGERDEAERQLRAVLDQDAANVEAHLHLGVLVRDAGRKDEARRLFERARELLPSTELPLALRREYRDFVDEALAELAGRGSAPGWQVTLGPRELGMPRFGEDGGPRPMPVRVGPKTGRNEPCPCGSGKKYKRCCGA
jgi:tetratricopeptide (TPR) repeat protein